MPFFIFLTIVLAIALIVVWNLWRRAVRAHYIRSFSLPPGLYERLRKKRPDLELKDCQLVARALRQFFLAYLTSGRRFVSMPSQVTDDLWHEFILYTKAYQSFCDKAFGRFLHHTPAVALGSDQQDNAGLRRTWWYCCREENIDPKKPTRLPLLFAIDGKMNLADGFRYAANCERLRQGGDGTAYCGTDFSSTAFDGGTDGFGDGASGDSGGDGGGCGGGCGGD